MPKWTWQRFIALVYIILYGFFYLGFWFHTSWKSEVFGKYTWKHLFFLVIATVPFSFPFLLRSLRRRLGSWKPVTFSLFPLVALLVLGYVIAEKRYYATRAYPFHPYLQVAPHEAADVSLEKAERTIRILALGGSTTYDSLLKSGKQYTDVLQEYLRREYPGRRIEVINRGQDWYTSLHSLIDYVGIGSDLNPDIVIVFHGINDMYRSCAPERFARGTYVPDYRHFYGPVMNAAEPPIFESRFLSQISRRWFSDLRFSYEEVDVPLEDFPSVETYDKTMRKLIRLVRADGRKIIVANQPYLYKENMTSDEHDSLWFGEKFCLKGDTYPSAQSLERVMVAFNKRTEILAREEGAVFVDIDQEIPKDLAHFFDDVHFRAIGVTRVGERFGEVITTQRWIR